MFFVSFFKQKKTALKPFYQGALLFVHSFLFRYFHCCLEWKIISLLVSAVVNTVLPSLLLLKWMVSEETQMATGAVTTGELPFFLGNFHNY